MLYDTLNHWNQWLSPASQVAQDTAQALSDPEGPWSWLPLARSYAAWAEVFHRLTRTYDKPAFGISELDRDGSVLTVDERTVCSTPFCNLVEFARSSTNKAITKALVNDPMVLIVAPLSGHYATLLRDTVRTMLPHHKVFITDWVNARDVPLSEGPFGLDTYVKTLEVFLEHLGADQVHVMGVCQPVVPVLGAVSRLATAKRPAPRSMILMGGPVDARQSPTAVNNLATDHSLAWFESNVIHRVPAGFPGEGRRVYPGFLQHLGFVAMNPERHAQAHWDFFNNLVKGDGDDAAAHRAFYDEYNAVMDMPAEFYLQTISSVFQNFDLAKGTWEIESQPVRPQDVKNTAVLTTIAISMKMAQASMALSLSWEVESVMAASLLLWFP